MSSRNGIALSSRGGANLLERDKAAKLRDLRLNETYARLFTVDVRNRYYASPGNPGAPEAAADFDIAPTPDTAKTMSGIGLIFRRDVDGFFVAYTESRKDAVKRFLASAEAVNVGAQRAVYRNYLSVFLTVEQPEFFNFTDLPTDTSTSQTCYYASNLLTAPEDERLRLTAGYLSDAAPFHVVTGQETVLFAPDVTEIQLFDAAGLLVYCYPRKVPKALLDAAQNGDGQLFRAPVQTIQCANVAEFLDAGGAPEPLVELACNITFQYLPQGKYTIRQVGRPELDRVVIYRRSANSAFCLLDIFLSQPPNGAPGNYPVEDVSVTAPLTAKITPKSYALDFQARATRWMYYFVPPKDCALEDLRIVDRSNRGALLPTTEAVPVRLGSGQTAWRVILRDPITLRSIPPQRFALEGRLVRPDEPLTAVRVLSSSLPVASARRISLEDAQLLLDDAGPEPPCDPTDGGTYFTASKIYVYL